MINDVLCLELEFKIFLLLMEIMGDLQVLNWENFLKGILDRRLGVNLEFC